MKLLILSVLFLTGCSTMSEYQSGCYDGLDKFIVFHPKATISNEENDEFRNHMENIKLDICRSLNAKRRMRLDR